jgi:hypothetical protein
VTAPLARHVKGLRAGKDIFVSDKLLKVSKLDAARRQLDTAIELWFREADQISIHTLVFAAFEIIQDINKKHGNMDVTLLGLARKSVKPEQVEKAIHVWKKAMRFFKHADRDPHEILQFNPDLSHSVIRLSIHGLGILGERRSDFQSVFMLWAWLHTPHLEGENPFINLDIQQIEDLRQVEKREFLKAALLALAYARARRAS